VCEFEEKASFLGFSSGKLLSSSRKASVLRKDYFGTTDWTRRSLSFCMLHSVPCIFYSHPLCTKIKKLFSHSPTFISYSSISTTKITQQNILFVSPKLTRMCSIFTNTWNRHEASKHDCYCLWFINWGRKQAASETCFFQIFVTTEKKYF